ncbi:alpha2-macroglobulin-like [Penaeus vannamei]|uniref:Alpha2-macroglobulin-like n=1 Tax=Penaeus vannamei TaxID=6689 RepID=A0A3R7LXP4_PENVA|nr:alpha2-macroglobulin-like [Penaeus vannamei]
MGRQEWKEMEKRGKQKENEGEVNKYPEIWVTSPSKTRIAHWKNVNNSAGLVHLGFQLDDGSEQGMYEINVKSTKFSETKTTFEVREYVLARFEVKVTTPDHISARKEILSIGVCAEYFFGQPVRGNATVSVSNDRKKCLAKLEKSEPKSTLPHRFTEKNTRFLLTFPANILSPQSPSHPLLPPTSQTALAHPRPYLLTHPPYLLITTALSPHPPPLSPHPTHLTHAHLSPHLPTSPTALISSPHPPPYPHSPLLPTSHRPYPPTTDLYPHPPHPPQPLSPHPLPPTRPPLSLHLHALIPLTTSPHPPPHPSPTALIPHPPYPHPPHPPPLSLHSHLDLTHRPHPPQLTALNSPPTSTTSPRSPPAFIPSSHPPATLDSLCSPHKTPTHRRAPARC